MQAAQRRRAFNRILWNSEIVVPTARNHHPGQVTAGGRAADKDSVGIATEIAGIFVRPSNGRSALADDLRD